MLLNFAYALLVFLCTASIFVMIYFKDLGKKILALSVGYSSLLLLAFLAIKGLSAYREVSLILIGMIILFSANLVVGVGILARISKSTQSRQ